VNKNQHLTLLDTDQIHKRVFDESVDAQRVVIVNNNSSSLLNSVGEKQPNLFDLFPKVEIKEIEKSVIIKELEIKEIEKPVIIIQEKITVIEVPKIIKEIEIKEVEKIVEKIIYKDLPISIERTDRIYNPISTWLITTVLCESVLLISLLVKLFI